MNRSQLLYRVEWKFYLNGELKKNTQSMRYSGYSRCASVESAVSLINDMLATHRVTANAIEKALERKPCVRIHEKSTKREYWFRSARFGMNISEFKERHFWWEQPYELDEVEIKIYFMPGYAVLNGMPYWRA